MRTALENGQQVVCVTATKGEAGVQDENRWPAAQLGAIRADELKAALQILGVKQHHWLDYVDGDCTDVPEDEAVDKLRALIKRYQPDTILTFGPEGLTGHPDHCTVSKWVDRAVLGTEIAVYHVVQLREQYENMREADERFNIFYNIEKPPLVETDEAEIVFYLPRDCVRKKYEGLKAMPSQTDAMFTALGEDNICRMIAVEAFVRA
jgi:LmbE family N-acetylglucosaminyl deacetylase